MQTIKHKDLLQGDRWNKELHSVTMLHHAIAYANKRWSVLPLSWIVEPGICSCSSGADCHSPGKHPLVQKGAHAATTDQNRVRRWWSEWPLANIGIATGFASGFVVIDIDGQTGHDSLHRVLFQKYGRCPNTLVSVTASGRHLLFRYPDKIVRNGAAILPGVDVRGDGGYIVAPPSMHSCGTRYGWHSQGHPRTHALADAEWFLRATSRPASRQNRRAVAGNRDEYRRDRLHLIKKGGRNAGLFKVCARFCGDGWCESDARTELHAVNSVKCVCDNGSPSPLSESEVDAIVSNVYKRYAANRK